MPALTAGGPALVHFLDFAQLNSVRTLPYLVEWERRYREAGLSVIGVQAPRFPFGADPEAGRRGPGARSGSSSRSRSTPSASSGAPTAARAGPASSSGASAARSPGSTSARANTWRPRMRSRTSCARSTPCARCRSRWRRCARPTRPGARVIAPSPEVFPGGSWERPWTAGEDGEELALDYAGGRRLRDGRGRGRDRGRARRRAPLAPIAIDGPGLYALAEHPRHEAPQPHPPPRPGPADLVGQLRRRRALNALRPTHSSLRRARRAPRGSPSAA